MQNEQTTYYFEYSFPELYRVVSYSIGIDTTVIPALHLLQDHHTPAAANQCLLESLMELAANPQIDHIYAQVGDLFLPDEKGALVNAGDMVIDLCDKNICLKRRNLFANTSEEV